MKFAIMGATGQTGSQTAKALQAVGHQVRAIVRNQANAKAMQALGYEAVIASITDREALTAAFTGVDGAYLMNPPAYQAEDLFAVAHQVHANLLAAMQQAKVPHVVALSSVGAQHARGTGNILTTYDLEQQVQASGLNITLLRAANFLENWASAIEKAQTEGVLPSMFLPLDKQWPMVSSIDIGTTAADLLIAGTQAPKLVELQGPQPYSANDAAAAIADLLHKPVQAVPVPTAKIAPFFQSLGFPKVTAEAFAEMMHGFNTDYIAFTGKGETRYGKTTIKQCFENMY
jgi:uncharacterized protein YbjT (DUF2867 family)